MEDASDSKLLEHARQGRPEAFSALIRRHDRYLYRVARSVMRSDQDAEDVVQEAYLQALAGLPDFRGDANLRTWLTRITLNAALRRRRRYSPSVDLAQVDTAQERIRSEIYLSALTTATPEGAAARSQIRVLLERAVDDLPPAFRTVFVMRDVEEASVEETARVLGLKPQTVRTRLHRARRMLRETLGEPLAAALKDVFPFERPRCDAMVHDLLTKAGLPDKSRPTALTRPR